MPADLEKPAAAKIGTITEDEASLYDRQIRLWGLDAQNRMRSATILVLCLRSLAHETIKNLVLAGIGRLIIMDEGDVTEEDLGPGFLFREEDGAVGKPRTASALPQIQSLNPLVSLTAIPTLAPFVRDPESSGAKADDETEMVHFLQRESVDFVVACDMTREEIERINAAARKAGAGFYAAGSYGFFGYTFADLGDNFEYVSSLANPETGSFPRTRLTYAPFTSLLDRSEWSSQQSADVLGGSPFRGFSRAVNKERTPRSVIAILALWDFERKYGTLPTGQDGQQAQLKDIAEGLRVELGVHEKAMPSVDDESIEHLAQHATASFPPTLAILGGLLAQDVLRAISGKDRPIANLLALDSAFGVSGTVTRWAMGQGEDI